ncbi:MAG: hypothetical protein SCALA702_12700 [Melioribacteraceae bacterium]|nr:MAG: hypothetical protein SCALA702_12700 [Melioribacteraceae bacterium]
MNKNYIILAFVLAYGIYDAMSNSNYMNTSIVMLIGIAIFLSGKKEAKGSKLFRSLSIVSILLAAVLYIYKISADAGF